MINKKKSNKIVQNKISSLKNQSEMKIFKNRKRMKNTKFTILVQNNPKASHNKVMRRMAKNKQMILILTLRINLRNKHKG